MKINGEKKSENLESETKNVQSIQVAPTNSVNFPQGFNPNLARIETGVASLCTHSKRIMKKNRIKEMEQENRQRKCQAVITLRAEQGLSVKQIANRLKVTPCCVTKVLKDQRSHLCAGSANAGKRQRFKMLPPNVANTIVSFIDSSQSLLSARDIRAFLMQTQRIVISKSHLIRFMKQALGYSFKRYGIVTPNQNSLDCKLQRQISAKVFIDIQCQGKTIINIDESVLQTSDHRRYGWGIVGKRTKEVFRQRLLSMNTITAAFSNGDVHFTLNHGKNNSLTFVHFLDKLISFLDSREAGWRQTHIIMIDNAPYHRSRLTKDYVLRKQLPLMYLGPYSFHMAPVEKIFSFMKNRDLNPDRNRVTSKQGMQLPILNILQRAHDELHATLWQIVKGIGLFLGAKIVHKCNHHSMQISKFD